MICLLILLYCLTTTKDCLERYLKAIVNWTLILLVLCWFWSLLHALNFLTLCGSYLVVDGVVLVLAVRKKRLVLKLSRIKEINMRLFSADVIMGAGILLLFAIVLRYAWHAVPYNWDSMTYHLARIANWEQNESVLPYATHIERQIASPVLGAYVNLFVYILGGRHDSLLNLLQCFSFGTNAVILYGISRKLGVDRKTAFLAPILYLCTPIALAEATTTQVDNFSTLWLLAFVYFILDLINIDKALKWDREIGERVVFTSFCIALGYLAKPSVCFAMAVFLLWLLIVSKKRRTELKIVFRYICLAIPAMTILLPGLLMNRKAFGTLFHSGVGQRQLIGTANPKYVLVNFLKNFTFNLASSKVETTRIQIENSLYRISELLQIDLNNPFISEDGRIFEFPAFPALSCDEALNMFLLVAALGMLIWFLFSRKRQKQLVRGFSACAISSYLIFCCFLRWERFINRYLIAYFALLVVFIVTQIHDMIKSMRKPIAGYAVSGILVFGSLINYCNEVQYLRDIAPFSRPDGYFTYYKDMKDEYLPILEQVKSGEEKKIGLVIREDTFEYPIWAIMQDENCEIRHIMVNNNLSQYEKQDFIPDYIIAERYAEEKIVYHDYVYCRKQSRNGEVFSLYERE